MTLLVGLRWKNWTSQCWPISHTTAMATNFVGQILAPRDIRHGSVRLELEVQLLR